MRLRSVAGRGRRLWRLSAVDPSLIADLGSRLSAVEALQSRQDEMEAPSSVAPQVADLARDTARHGEVLDSFAAWLADLERSVTSCIKSLSDLDHPALGGPDGRIGAVDLQAAIKAQLDVWVTMDWLAHAAVVPEDLLVSVVTATRNRPHLLRRAVESVLAQSYRNLEIVVVDDSDAESGPQSAAGILAGIDDARVRIIRTPARRGPAAAFNVGLDAVRGDLIAALDDDNVMHPEWLRSAAWAFQTMDVEVLFGARTVEDRAARDGVRSGNLPLLEFFPYVRRKHEQANYIDRNVLIYRSSLADLRYDEDLPAAIDWDHSLRMFQRTEPFALPAIACYYCTTHPGRVTDEPSARDAVKRVRVRAFTGRPMRVLVHTAMYPVMSESYIAGDIQALEACGAQVEVTALLDALSRPPGVSPPRQDVEKVLAEFSPDVVLMHWSTHAEGQLDLMERFDQPFACRIHSFEDDAEQAQRLLHHPLCIAVFAHQFALPELPDGVIGLAPTVGPEIVIPPSPAERNSVVSVSAGLPKKNFPQLVEALAALPEFDRHIILARSNGYEGVADEVRALVEAVDPTISVDVDVPHDEVLKLVAMSSTLLYTLAEDSRMGMPMSIVEAMLCGTLVVAPDRPVAHDMVGPDLRTYSTTADIVAHVRQIAAGGSEIEEARERIRERAQERFRDPRAQQVVHDTLRSGIESRLRALP